MSPTNGHANDPANVPSDAVRQLAPSASDASIPTALTPTTAKVNELIANLEVPFYASVIEWRSRTPAKAGLLRPGGEFRNGRTAIYQASE